MRFRIAVVLFAGAAPYAVLAAQATGARRPVRTPASPSPAATVPAAAARANAGSNTSIGLRVGTLGVGVEVSRLLSDHIGLRVGGSYAKLRYNFRDNQTSSDPIDWDVNLKGTGVSGLLDWYPGKRGVFRLSVGAMTVPFKVDGVGVIVADTAFTLFDQRFRPASTVGDLLAAGKYPGVRPYVGLGFGTPASSHRGVGFIFDLGVAIGRPRVSVTSTTAATSTNPLLRQDLAALQNDWQTEGLDLVPVYPVLSLGFAYRF
jgi:hypothetical protein